MPRAVAELARGIAAYPEPCRFHVTLSVIELYCERIKDLLDPTQDNLQVAAGSRVCLLYRAQAERHHPIN